MQAKNPILPGCYPDPSICRVGDDYYLVLSTFEYLPGLPIFHSRDLANWTQIGHVLDREGMMNFDGIKSSNGIFAPTLRHNPRDNKFYLVCTLVGSVADQYGQSENSGPRGGNFIVTADHPSGPWSDPIWLNKPGIDPSLFFDDDGRVWLHGTRLAEPGEWFHQTEVWLQELDPVTLQPIGEEHILWSGAVRGAVWCEGPHLYRIGDYYYLLTAEGGTEFHHAISISRSRAVTGPYEGNKCNPIFTHRNLGRNYPIMGIGHADLVPFGSADWSNPAVTSPDAGGWFAVMLGMRLYGGYHYNLGRETFLVPVTWEDDWPVFALGAGRVPDAVDIPVHPAIAAAQPASAPTITPTVTAPQPTSAPTVILRQAHRAQNAESPTVPPTDLRWSAVRTLPTTIATPSGEAWRMPLRSVPLSERGISSFLGIRQTDQNCQVEITVDTSKLQVGDWAGIAIRQSEKDYATIMASPIPGLPNNYHIHTELMEKGTARLLESQNLAIADNPLVFTLDVIGQDYHAFLNTSSGKVPVGTIDGRTLDTAAAGGFLGLWIGVYGVAANPNPNSEITATLKYSPR